MRTINTFPQWVWCRENLNTQACSGKTDNNHCDYRNEQGVILIIVLFLIVLLAAVIMQFQFSMKIEYRIARNRADALQASYMLRSRAEAARLAIMKDIPLTVPARIEADKDASATAADNGTADPTVGDVLGVSIIDASSRININRLIRANGTPDPDLQKVLENLLAGLEADPALIDRIIDFIDPDTDGGDHESDECLNRPFQNITELALIEDIPAALLHRRPDDPSHVCLFDLLTVFGDGKINVNTAPAVILTAMLANPTDEPAITAICEERLLKPFDNPQAIFQIKGVSRGIFGAMEQHLTTKPTVFLAELTAVSGRVTRRAYAVYERTKDDVVLRHYREE